MELAFRLWSAQKKERAKLVFLHGMGGTGSLWRPVAAALENEFSILAPDQRGHGRSRVPFVANNSQTVQYTPLDYGKDLVETLDTQQFHPCWLIGHSMGVRTACAAAHLRPEWVRGLVLIDLGFSGPAGGGLGERLARFLEMLPMDFASREEARNYMNRTSPDESITQYLLAVSTKTVEGNITFPFDKTALIQTIHAARNASIREWVAELGARGVPILVLRGEISKAWSAAEFREEMERFRKFNSITFVEFSGAGHGLPFERRGEFVETLRDFIGK